MALALAVNLPRADAATHAIPFVRRTRGEAGVLVTPDPLSRCVRFTRVSLLRLRAGAERVFIWGWFSALRNIGPTVYRSKHQKVAMLLVSCG